MVKSSKLYINIIDIASRSCIVKVSTCEIVTHESLACGLNAVVRKACGVDAMVTYVE